MTSSVPCDEGEKEVCAYSCDDVGDELSVGGGRSVLRTQSQPLAVSLSGPAGAVVLSEEGVDLRVGSEEVRFGRTAVSASRDGEGRVYFADGTRYEGEVRAGLCDGSGVLRGPHDELLTVGVWRDGKLASSLPLPPTRPSSAPASAAARVTGGDGQAAPAEVVQPADPIQPVEPVEMTEQASKHNYPNYQRRRWRRERTAGWSSWTRCWPEGTVSRGRQRAACCWARRHWREGKKWREKKAKTKRPRSWA